MYTKIQLSLNKTVIVIITTVFIIFNKFTWQIKLLRYREMSLRVQKSTNVLSIKGYGASTLLLLKL